MSQGIDTHAIAVAQEQISNWLRAGCTARDCLSALGVCDEVPENQQTWEVVFLATYEASVAQA